LKLFETKSILFLSLSLSLSLSHKTTTTTNTSDYIQMESILPLFSFQLNLSTTFDLNYSRWARARL
jgi:hypothetical protein